MKFTPLKLALGVSLLIHGGMVSAFYALRSEMSYAPVEFHHEPIIEMIREPEPELVADPEPVKAVEVPKPLPPLTSAPVVPESQPPVAVAATVLAVSKSEGLQADVPIVTEVVPSEAALQPVKASVATSANVATGGGVPANYLLNPKPIYPTAARQRKEEGVVLLAVQLSQEGVPGRIEIKQSSHFSLLDEAAVKAVSQWRFTPARLGNVAVASQIEVPIRFKLSDAK